MVRTEEARGLWQEAYGGLNEERPGLLGAVTARGAAQVSRLSVIYALLDQTAMIGIEHLKAALAVWDYAEESAGFVFGKALGDPAADRIFRALREAGTEGLTRTEIGELFRKHKSGRQIDRALELLASSRLAETRKEGTRGRSVERWIAL